MHSPDPRRTPLSRGVVERLLNCPEVPSIAPAKPQLAIAEPRAGSLPQQPLAELAVRNHQPLRASKHSTKICSHCVIRQRPRTADHDALQPAHQLTQTRARLLVKIDELLRTMRNRHFVKPLDH